MIIYRYSTSETPLEVYKALTDNNEVRVKIGLNCGYTSGDNGKWIHDSGWEQLISKDSSIPAPTLEYLIIRKDKNRTEIQIAFYYNVLITDVETTISRSKNRRLLIEKTLKKKLRDFVVYPQVLN